MSDMTEEPRSAHNDNTLMAHLRHRIYQYRVVWLAVGLFIIGLFFITLATFIPGSEHDPWWSEVSHHILRDLGIAAVISALLGSAYEYALRDDFAEEAKSKLREALKEDQEDHQALEKLRTAGLGTIHEQLSRDLLEQNFARVIRQAQTDPTSHPRIRILETWTARGIAGIMELIKEAVSKGCKVEILLLDPLSHQVAYRAKAMRKDTDWVRDQIKDELQSLRRITSELEDSGDPNLDVKVYNATPTNHVYDFDGTMLIGVYWRKIPSFKGPQLEIRTQDKRSSDGSQLAQFISDQFEDLWKQTNTDAAEALKKLEEVENQQEQAYVIKVQLKEGDISHSRRIRIWRDSLIPIYEKQRGS